MRKTSHIWKAVDVPPDFIPLCLEGSLCSGDESRHLGIIPYLMGEDDSIHILPGLVSLCAELAQGFLTVTVHLTGYVCAEGSIAGHAPCIDCLMDHGLGHNMVHGFKPGEVLKLLGKFCAQSLPLCG